MPSLSEPTTMLTDWTVRAVVSITQTQTHNPTPSTILTLAYSSNSAAAKAVEVDSDVDIPFTCDALYMLDISNRTTWESGFVPLQSNPDIAGLGVSVMSEKVDGC
jgi:cytoskeletal protein RodZ